MAINWNEIDVDAIIEQEASATDDALASKVSSLTRMTDEEVKELFPEASDVKKLAELMQIVKSSEDRNNKINKIVSNAEEFGGIVLTLLGKLA
jgi:hypothetical protein